MRERETIEKGAVDSRNIGVALEQMKLLHVSLLRDRPFFQLEWNRTLLKMWYGNEPALITQISRARYVAHGTRKMAVEIFSCVYLPGSL